MRKEDLIVVVAVAAVVVVKEAVVVVVAAVAMVAVVAVVMVAVVAVAMVAVVVEVGVRVERLVVLTDRVDLASTREKLALSFFEHLPLSGFVVAYELKHEEDVEDVAVVLDVDAYSSGIG